MVRNGDCSVSCGTARMSPVCVKTFCGNNAVFVRVLLIPRTSSPSDEPAPAAPAGWMIVYEFVWLVGTTTPLNNADHAASTADRSEGLAATLTESCPRVALSLNAVVKRSNNRRSCTGAALVASNRLPSPVQVVQ